MSLSAASRAGGSILLFEDQKFFVRTVSMIAEDPLLFARGRASSFEPCDFPRTMPLRAPEFLPVGGVHGFSCESM